MANQPLILIIDDDPNFREIFSMKLSAEGYRTETAESGEAGIEKTKALKPDLILMDVNMPGMDGAAAVLKLREDSDTKDMKIAFLTSLGDPHLDMLQTDDKMAQSFGAKGYLKKTDDLDTLAGQIKGFLTP
jgi:twitching motility two-component system response regulator PilH